MRGYLIGATFGAALALAFSGHPAIARAPHYAASITRTAYGIPHINAKDWGGIGYGVAYAYAEDNLCLLAEEFATVAGERSLHFGPKNYAVLGFERIDNLSSDIFFRSAIDLAALRKSLPAQGRDVNRLVAGYVAGYNKFLRDAGPAGIPAECRGKAWVRPITLDDMLRLTEKQVLLAGSLALAPAIVNAAPPTLPQTGAVSIKFPKPEEFGIGSNGWAFGSDVTTNGRGLVVGNPHFPWNGPSRFWEMHLTIPGEVDVMGVGLAGTPLVALGFNKDVAWTHTVTEARHFTLFELELVPGDPTRYLVDGKAEAMTSRTISVPMPGGAAPANRTLYASRYGPMLTIPFLKMPWSKTTAYTVRDANKGNQRSIAAWMAMDKAKSVADIKAAVSSTLGIPWVNTIAADRAGNALHADITAVPNISAEQVKSCATPLSAEVGGRLTLLDGRRSACNWRNTPGTAAPYLLPASDQAVYERRDYVANSNDSYWLSNPAAPYRQLSPVLGNWGTARTLRTRSGLIELANRLAGTDGLPGTKIDPQIAEAMAFANHSLAGDLVVEPLLKLCADQPLAAANACAALAGWDRKFDVDSRGAYLFATFWQMAARLPGLWRTPFTAADPVNTPRDLVTEGPMGAQLLAALAKAAEAVTKQGIALDARWGDVQFAVRGDQHIPIHGADGQLGVLNVQIAEPVAGGVTPRHGSSYVQVVTFDEAGPVADAVLSYSQSTNPASPHFGDQTLLYSAKRWHRLPFTPAQMAADGGTTHKAIGE